MKHTIWSNDYDQIEAIANDIKSEAIDEDEPMTDDEAWERAYDLNNDYLDDERINLDIVIPTDIIVFADLGLWNGRRSGYKVLNSRNLKDVLDVCCGDYIDWFVNENGEMIITDCHHDGTNYYTVRAMRDLTDAQFENFSGKLWNGITEKDVKRYTRRLGDYPAKVFGWKLRGGVHA